MIRQTTALFLDAYRELNAKKLFWIVLGISLLCAGSLATVGINEQGLKMLIWDIPSDRFNSEFIQPAFFYKSLFIVVGVKLWLAWAASILAIISTASIFPDFISGGAIELVLSKPISRLRLFITRYLTGLLFVTMQVTVFTVASFLIIGFRSGEWIFGLAVAIPLIVLFFSFLFSICTLVGILTRSTMTAFLVTILLWGGIFMIHGAETGLLLSFKVRQDIVVSTLQVEIPSRESEIEELQAEADQNEDRIERLEEKLGERQAQLDSALELQDRLTKVHALMFAVKTILPKTSETIELLSRSLYETTDLEYLQKATTDGAPDLGGNSGVRVSQARVANEVERIVRERSLGWVLGTSIAFELVVLCAGAFVFCRRDF